MGGRVRAIDRRTVALAGGRVVTRAGGRALSNLSCQERQSCTNALLQDLAPPLEFSPLASSKTHSGVIQG